MSPFGNLREIMESGIATRKEDLAGDDSFLSQK